MSHSHFHTTTQPVELVPGIAGPAGFRRPDNLFFGASTTASAVTPFVIVIGQHPTEAISGPISALPAALATLVGSGAFIDVARNFREWDAVVSSDPAAQATNLTLAAYVLRPGTTTPSPIGPAIPITLPLATPLSITTPVNQLLPSGSVLFFEARSDALAGLVSFDIVARV
jgi:hypothetical protein